MTKEELEQMKNDPTMRFLARMCGINIDNIQPENVEVKNKIEDNLDKALQMMLDQRVKNGEMVMEEHNGEKYYRLSDEYYNKIKNNKKPYVAPKAEEVKAPNFVMSKEQFRQFCLTYSELLNSINKLEYVYGISFEAQSTGKNLSVLIREIIWNFVRIIFGDENADDIADYLYGNSNFDSPEKLYDELV